MKEAAKDMKDDAATARDDLKKDIKESITRINKKIDETDKKMEKATVNQQKAWEKDRISLIQSRDRLNARLKEMGSDMKDGWKGFMADVRATLKEVKQKLDQ